MHLLILNYISGVVKVKFIKWLKPPKFNLYNSRISFYCRTICIATFLFYFFCRHHHADSFWWH
jgi:hypothetical protein